MKKILLIGIVVLIVLSGLIAFHISVLSVKVHYYEKTIADLSKVVDDYVDICANYREELRILNAECAASE